MSDAPTSNTLRDGRYTVLGVLGSGAQGDTLDAQDLRDGRAVAIKRFQVRGAKSWKDVELAEREARVLSTLSHPNLPVYIEHFEEAGALYLVMQKIDGETLSSLRRRRATLSSEDVARFLADADSVLGYLHSRMPAIIHRDIKPGNVIRRGDGSFAFVDFGSVRDQLKPEGGSTVVGTFGYMAPEQFQGRALPGSDVYGVAATALSLVTGREPEELPHRGLAIDVPAALGRGAEPWLVRTLSAMLEPDPDRRPTRVPQGGSSHRGQGRGDEARSAREVRERAREHARQRRQERRSAHHNDREQARDAAHGERRRARGFSSRPAHGWQSQHYAFGALTPFLLIAVVFGVTVARVATFGLFRVFLPTLLFAMSALFGGGLRRAAWRCQDVGSAADRGLRQALSLVRERMFGSVFEGDLPVEGEDVHPVDPEPPLRTRAAASKIRISEEPEAHLFDRDSTEDAERRRQSR